VPSPATWRRRHCDHVVTEWFRPGTEPVDACRVHVRAAVDTRSGALATGKTPRAALALRTFVDLPPRYASWAASAGLPRVPSRVQEGPSLRTDLNTSVKITSPENGMRVLRDPETPEAQSTLALRAVVEPASPQVVWYVDGKAYRTVDRPYETRWPLSPGAHVIEARLPNVATRSGRIHVYVE
jgi:hypothetical protein